MRAANRALTSTAAPQMAAGALLLRLLVAIVATLALLLVWRPTVLYAQDAAAAPQEPAGRTHVVKAGETLWSLAARYYGDGHQWQNLARRNGIPITGEPPLKVGMRLTVPARPTVRGAKAAEVAAAPADSTVPKAALAKAGEGTLPAPEPAAPRATGGSLAAQTAGKSNASKGASAAPAARVAAAPKPSAAKPAEAARPAADSAARADLTPSVGKMMGERSVRRIGLVDQDAAVSSRKSSEVVTVFHRDLPDAAEAERRTRAVLRPNTPTPRVAEYLAAPFVAESRSLSALGSIAARVGSPTQTGETYPQRAIKTDQVELAAPARGSYKVGDQLVSFATPVMLDKSISVVVPTGVLEVIKAEAGKPALALVRRQSGRIEAGQQVVAASAGKADWVQTVRLDRPDVETTIKWLDPTEAQPTLQSYVVLAAGSGRGLAAGDEVAVYGRLAKGTVEAVAATARVVRVDQGYATAVITKQYQTDITTGMTVRRYAKAP